jgi:Tfp pilus assembly protein PilF
MKEAADALYSAQQYEQAHAAYTGALETAGSEGKAVILCNRAACSIKLQSFASAREDTQAAIALNPR